jgi:hypothetical protein
MLAEQQSSAIASGRLRGVCAPSNREKPLEDEDKQDDDENEDEQAAADIHIKPSACGRTVSLPPVAG